MSSILFKSKLNPIEESVDTFESKNIDSTIMMDDFKLPPTSINSMPPRVRTQIRTPEAQPTVKQSDGLHLIPYLEKSKVKEDMRRLISIKITQLRTVIEIDYFEARNLVRKLTLEKGLSEENYDIMVKDDPEVSSRCSTLKFMNHILINIKTTDCDFPNLSLMKRVCHNYLQFQQKHEPNVVFSTEESMRRYQDKISSTLTLMHLCDVYQNNSVWKEFIIGVEAP
jgi:hypothetical protein